MVIELNDMGMSTLRAKVSLVGKNIDNGNRIKPYVNSIIGSQRDHASYDLSAWRQTEASVVDFVVLVESFHVTSSSLAYICNQGHRVNMMTTYLTI